MTVQALIDQWRLHPDPEVGSCANQLAGWLRTQEEDKELTLIERISALPLICEMASKLSPARTAPCDAICLRKRIVALIQDMPTPEEG
jgi:hypothetical protein